MIAFLAPFAGMKKTILLADDDLSVRASLSNLIESEDYTVLQAADGYSAITCVANTNPDLVLLDVNMPYMEKWQAYKWLKQQRPDIPVIIISARPPSEAVALRADRDTYMEKPLEPKHLLDTIRSLVGPKNAVTAVGQTGLQPVGI